VEIKRTIPRGVAGWNSKDFRTKKIFVGGIPSTVTEGSVSIELIFYLLTVRCWCCRHLSVIKFKIKRHTNMDNDDDIFQGLDMAVSLLNGCWFFTGVYWEDVNYWLNDDDMVKRRSLHLGKWRNMKKMSVRKYLSVTEFVRLRMNYCILLLKEGKKVINLQVRKPSRCCGILLLTNICFVGIFHNKYGAYEILGVHVIGSGRSRIWKVGSYLLLTIRC